MEQMTHFRSAFNGFNKEDVVRYLEFINNKHASQVAQLTNELEFLRSHRAPGQDELEQEIASLTAENTALHQRIAELEAGSKAAPKSAPATLDELEAYRRAERVERIATERAQEIGNRTAAVLADASTRVDGAAQRISEISAQLLEQLSLLKGAMTDSHEAFEDASRGVADLNTQEK